MKRLSILVGAIAVALGVVSSAFAWHANDVIVAANCDTKTGTYVVTATIVQNPKYPATLYSISPSSFAGNTSGTKSVTVVIKFTNNEKQTWKRYVTLDGKCTIPPVVQALHLRNTVTNNNGGTAVPTAWTLSATGAGGSPTNLSGKTPVDSGAGFKADTYTLAQTGGPSGYTAGPWSCVLTGTSTVGCGVEQPGRRRFGAGCHLHDQQRRQSSCAGAGLAPAQHGDE